MSLYGLKFQLTLLCVLKTPLRLSKGSVSNSNNKPLRILAWTSSLLISGSRRLYLVRHCVSTSLLTTRLKAWIMIPRAWFFICVLQYQISFFSFGHLPVRSIWSAPPNCKINTVEILTSSNEPTVSRGLSLMTNLQSVCTLQNCKPAYSHLLLQTPPAVCFDLESSLDRLLKIYWLGKRILAQDKNPKSLLDIRKKLFKLASIGSECVIPSKVLYVWLTLVNYKANLNL